MLRVIIEDAPAGGAWNMAVDEALLDSVAETGEPVLRWYAWREPTISLGYFQSMPEFAPNDPLFGLHVVRRLSGGGAILHHHEWTYSCVLPATHPLVQRPTELYTELHRGVIEVLEQLGAPARLRGTRTVADERSVFLCFFRGDPRDVVLTGHKIVGSAQRRRGGAVLQHGSLLLRASVHASNQPGLRDLADIPVDDATLRVKLMNAVARRLIDDPRLAATANPWRLDTLRPAEERAALTLESERYTRLDWKAK